MARAPVPGECKHGLEPLLGPDGCARLQAALVRRAAAWAVSVAPGAAHLGFSPRDAGGRMGELVPAELDLFPQAGGPLGRRLAAAVDQLSRVDRVGSTARREPADPGPLLIAGVDAPRLGAGHANAALDDLADGWDVSFGPSMDGGCYLLGVARADPAALRPAIGAWRRAEIMERTLRICREQRLSVALLGSERELHDPGDVRALLADPLAPADVVAALQGAT
jgi:glycosyltransferase A (GT-A) superfamily protein (DUF2064 family)